MGADGRDIIRAVVERPPMRLAPGRCIRLRGGAPCESCASACSLGLPFAAQGEILGAENAARCTGCGACAAACPTGAIELPEATLSGWLRRLETAAHALSMGEELSISCGSSPAAGHVAVSCIRGLDASLLLWTLAVGSPEVSLLIGDCRSCESGGEAAADSVNEVASRATGFATALRLGAIHVTQRHRDGLEARIGQAGFDRREFFSSLRDEGRSLIGTILRETLPGQDPVASDELDAGDPSPRRLIAVDTVEQASARAGLDPRSATALPAEGPGALSHRVPRTGTLGCSACGECAVFCPTGALRVRVVDNEWRLSVSSRRCVGCGLCERLCRASAIALEDGGLAGLIRPKRVVLYRGEIRTCSRCSAIFAGPDTRPSAINAPSPAATEVLCPECRHRDGLFADCC